MGKRVAVYTRVSTDMQTAANQVPEVEQLAAVRGDVVARYSEIGSAAKRRPAFESMLRDAKRGAFDVLVVWSIDRFGRSMVGNINDLVELDRVGVTVVSAKESWLDTTGPTRGLLVAIFSWMAEQERARIIERVGAGMARAKREGTKSGRPIGRAPRWFDVDGAKVMLAGGASTRAVAAHFGVGQATLARAIARRAA